MTFFGDIFWELLGNLLASDLFQTANDRFSISSIFFEYKTKATKFFVLRARPTLSFCKSKSK